MKSNYFPSKKGFTLYMSVIKHPVWVSIYSKLSWHWIFLGGYRFFSDLLNKINALNTSTMAGASPGEVGKSVQVKIEFIRVKSYLNDK